jgi:tetratricopeptide (TPR) repeat protein
MSEKIWQKINYFIGLLPVGALFGLAYFVSGVEIKDLDLWLHLGVGKYITEHRNVPFQDVLSCTIAGKSWVNHEWLFQVLLNQVYQLWGVGGILGMQTTLVMLTLAILVLLGFNKEKQLSTAIVLWMTFLIYQQRFTNRPDLFSLFFFALYIFILAIHIDKRWATPFLVFVQILWSNIHGFFFFGPLFVFLAFVCEWAKRHLPLPYEWNDVGRLSDAEYKRIKILLLLVTAACVVNPYGVGGAWYPLGVFFSLSGDSKIFFDFIEELQKPITWSTIFDLSQVPYFKVMIFISTISFILNRRRIDISALLLWLVFLVFSLQAARNQAFFAFAAYLAIVTNSLSVDYEEIVPIQFSDKKFQYITEVALKILMLFWIFRFAAGMASLGYYDFEKYQRKSEFGGISLMSYPHKAVDFLIKNKVKGNFFNDFNSGAYLVGRVFPDIKVFIDGRTEVYGGEFFREHQKFWNGDEAVIKRNIEKYNLTGALFNSIRQSIHPKLLKNFYHNPEWALVYFDYDAVVFLKNIDENRDLITQYKIDLTQWEPPKMDLVKLGTATVDPFQNYFRALLLESLDFDEPALKEIAISLKVAPDYVKVYQLAGKIYTKRKDFAKAFENYRIAVSIDKSHQESRYHLALSLYDLGEYKSSIKQYEEIIRMWPLESRGYFFLARTLTRDQQFDQAFEVLKRAHKLNPMDVIDVLKIGDIALEFKEFDRARQFYEVALDAPTELEKVYLKLSKLLHQMGKFDQAQEMLRKASAIAPKDEGVLNAVQDLSVR